MANIQVKEDLCNQYKDILRIIYSIGNKVMLQTDLVEIAKL